MVGTLYLLHGIADLMYSLSQLELLDELDGTELFN